MAKKARAKTAPVKVMRPEEDEKQDEAAKTARLRALRLAKEAADRDAASRESTATAPKSRGHQISPPKLRLSCEIRTRSAVSRSV
jgi:hypothetical protein